MNEEKRKAVWKNVRDFVDYIVTPIAIALLVIFFVFAASKALGMGVFERYGIAATRDDITEAVDPIARQVASNETAIASHATQLESLGNLAYLDTLAASDVGAYSTNKVDELLDGKLDKSGGTVGYSDRLWIYVGGSDDYDYAVQFLQVPLGTGRILVWGRKPTGTSGAWEMFSGYYLPIVGDTARTLALAAPTVAAADNLAALDAEGNPTDSGIPKSDVITTSSAAWIDVTNRLHQLERQLQM